MQNQYIGTFSQIKWGSYAKYAIPVMLFIVMASFSQAFSLHSLPANHFHSGEKVWVNDSKVFISAEPHTLHSSGWVYFNLVSKVYTGDVDVALGYNSSDLKAKKAEVYSPHTITWDVKRSYYLGNVTNFAPSTSSCEIGDEDSKLKYLVSYKIPVYDENGENITGWNDTSAVVCFDSYEQVRSGYRVFWTETKSRVENWKSIANKFNKITFDYQKKDLWIYAGRFSITAGTNYTMRVWFDIPVTHPSSGEYLFAIKPSSETLPEARSVGHLYWLDPWWNSSWGYRKAINLTTSSGTTPNDYQVLLNVTYDSDIQSDFDDLRFVDDDDSTLLPAWLENKSDGNWATVWVKVNDTIGTSGTTIYMYYGNTGASDYWNGEDTFEFFDDFLGTSLNTSKWHTGGTYNVGDSIVNITSGGDSWITSQPVFNASSWTSDNLSLRARADGSSRGFQLGWGDWKDGSGADGGVDGVFWFYDSAYVSYYTLKKVDTSSSYNETTLTPNSNFHIWSLDWKSSSCSGEIDGSHHRDLSSIPNEKAPVLLRDYTANKLLRVDWIFLHKYADPEPTYTFGSEESSEDTSPPSFSNWEQEPPDLNSSSIGKMYINVTISDSSGVNNSSVRFYHFINSTDYPNADWCFLNGTAGDFYHVHNMTNLTDTLFNITLHTYAYNPSTHNVHPDTIASETKYNYTLDSNGDALKIRFYNVSTKPNTTYMFKVRAFQNSGDLNVYYCNSSYTTGKVYNSPYCVLISTLLSQNTSTKYQNIPFYGDNDTHIDGIKITETSYFVLYADHTTDWEIEYVNVDSNSVQTSSNSGTSWSDETFSINSWVIQIAGDDITSFNYFVYACDNEGNCGNSTTQTDYYAITNQPPYPPPNVIVPDENTTYNGVFNITWTASSDPNGDDFNYTIALYYENQTLAGILADDNITSDKTWFEFNSTSYGGYDYYLIMNATDEYGATSTAKTPYTFHINAVPTVPTGLNPDDAYVTTYTPSLSWDASNDGDGDTITYYIDVANDSGFSNVVWSGSTTSTSITTGTLENDTEYWWRVLAGDSYENSSWSSTANFTVNVTDPSPQITLNYPSDGATDIELNPYLNVTVTDPNGYDMNVSFYSYASIDGETAYSCDGSFDTNYPCSNAVDENWVTYSRNNAGATSSDGCSFVYENFTIPATALSGKLKQKFGSENDGCGAYVSYYNYNTNSWTVLYEYPGGGTFQIQLPDGALNGSILQIRTPVCKCGGYINAHSLYYESLVNWMNQTCQNNSVTSGSDVTCQLTNLDENTTYEWITTATNGNNTTTSDTWNFTTTSDNPNVTLVSPNGSVYVAGEPSVINFTFYATDMSNLSKAELWGNFSGTWELNQTNFSSVGNGTNYTFNVSLPYGTYIWNVNVTDSYGHSAFATSNYTVTVGPIQAYKCTTGTPFLNFTFWDEENVSVNLNGSMEMTLWMYPPDRSSNESYNMSWYNVSYAAVCIDTNSTYVIDTWQVYWFDGYRTRSYLIYNLSVNTSETHDISLYQISNTTSDRLTVSVEKNGISQEGKYTKLLRYYPALNEYKTVEIEKTDDNGNAIFYVHPYDVWYRFLILDGDREVLLPQSRMTSTTKTLEISSASSSKFFYINNGVSGNCSVDTNKTLISCLISDTSNVGQTYYFTVKEVGLDGDTLCYQTGSSGPAVMLSCNISNATTDVIYNLILKMKHSSPSPSFILASGVVEILNKNIYGDFGLLAGFVVIAGLGFVGATISASMLVISVLIGIIFVVASQFIGMAPTTIGILIFLGGLILVRLQK